MELLKHLQHIKDEKQIESQKELMLIKEVKRNLSEKLIRAHLPTGFAEFYQLMEVIDYYDKPDYDRMAKLLEKAKEAIPMQPRSKSNNTLVDQDLFEMDPLFLKFNECLNKLRATTKQIQRKQASSTDLQA
jgi:hypothetical protein